MTLVSDATSISDPRYDLPMQSFDQLEFLPCFPLDGVSLVLWTTSAMHLQPVSELLYS